MAFERKNRMLTHKESEWARARYAEGYSTTAIAKALGTTPNIIVWYVDTKGSRNRKNEPELSYNFSVEE